MKLVVIGGSGLIGSRVVQQLRERGHDALAASPATGVDTVTGEGLAEALRGADVVVDLANSPSFEADAALHFFRTAGQNLLAAEAAAGVRHHVALSVVGTERLTESGYFRAKLAQEELVTGSGIPYSLVRATQFFPFVPAIADLSTVDGQVHLPPALIQPVSPDDVATTVADVALGEPLGGLREVAGPEAVPLDALVRDTLRRSGDPRPVVADPDARYSGARLTERTLLPGPDAVIGRTRYADWLQPQH
jgi:uncharacterized protein YbjT (DUF2867 family)